MDSLSEVQQNMYAKRCLVHHLRRLFETYYKVCDADTLESFAATIASAMRSAEADAYYDWDEQAIFDLAGEDDDDDEGLEVR
jgi:hypothetical protein